MQTAADRTAPPSPQSPPGGVTLINSFEVPAGREAAFVAQWHALAAWFRTQPGYVANRLHRAVSPGAANQFVNVVQWRSEADYQAAHRAPAFLASVRAAEWREFPNHPALYQVAFEASAAEGIVADATATN
jgi:heme-degrading monooxygenase HmoA